MDITSIKKVNLGIYPTPIEKLENITRYLGKGQVYIKRDDITGPALRGNKTRKLEYLLYDALEKGCTAVLTTGGVQTNHGRTTVGAAVKLGLKPILVVDGEDNGYLSGNLTLDALMGADIYFVKDENKVEEVIQDICRKYEQNGDKVYCIPMGGSNILGAVGYMMCVKEILDQINRQNLKIDHIVCNVGSMGTYAGLLLGAKYFGAPFDIIGIPVSPGEKESGVLEYADRISREYSLGVEIKPEDVKIAYGPQESPYAGFGYNQPDSLTRKAVILMAEKEGIFLDPTYTGKSFRGMVDIIQKEQYIKNGENTLFIHTGGAPALWAKEHLDDMQIQLRENCKTTQL